MSETPDSTLQSIKPYARLLTMLGDQLIKNERIALVELIKNSYDADADWVDIRFEGFGEGFGILENSKIIIEDSGYGMTSEVIINHWLNPATPEKKNRKSIKKTTDKGRVIQGEKGIGRFAILKLGRLINVITRSIYDKPEIDQNTKKMICKEHVIEYDFTPYDDDFLSLDNKKKPLLLSDLAVRVYDRPVEIFNGAQILRGIKQVKRNNYGTRIEISCLKGAWSEKKVRDVYKDIRSLGSIFDDTENFTNDFDVMIYKDSKNLAYDGQYKEELNFLIENKSVVKVTDGYFDDQKLEFRFKLQGVDRNLSLNSELVTGDKIYRTLKKEEPDAWTKRKIECGSFGFTFYVFDFSSDALPKYELDTHDKGIIKEHRIYLYRDGVRVYPYGEPNDDWLRIDQYRGTISAGQFLSNNQIVGYVNISQEHNPKLKDKTNREGLIDDGNATEDFITLIQLILSYIRKKPYQVYKNKTKDKSNVDVFKTKSVATKFQKIKEEFSDNPRLKKEIDALEKDYNKEKEYLVKRTENTEELAGVGLAVETASHDVMKIITRVVANVDGLLKDINTAKEIDKFVLMKELEAIRGSISFLESQLTDIQQLFRSTKKRNKNIRVKNIVENVYKIYKSLLDHNNIAVSIEAKGSPLVVKTTDALLLQLLINLFDNSAYWLMETDIKAKKIKILLDGNSNQLIFSDNGPGIEDSDAPYIFDAFYSLKGDEGRGLGLYIAKQLLERSDFDIQLASIKSEKILSGANFIIDFNREED